MSLTAHLGKFSTLERTSQETANVCLEMFNRVETERTIAIRKRKFLNKFSVIHNALCGGIRCQC